MKWECENMIKNILRFLSWLGDETIEFFQNLARDVRSLRSLLCWVYCFLYIWVAWYALTHYPSSANTVVMTTGGIVSAIFTGYVFTKSYEKVKAKEAAWAAVKANEEGASD